LVNSFDLTLEFPLPQLSHIRAGLQGENLEGKIYLWLFLPQPAIVGLAKMVLSGQKERFLWEKKTGVTQAAERAQPHTGQM
jgi:hypothetical protein